MTFDGQELYSTLAEKASAFGFSLIQNHPFVDGNKRTGHAALETYLVLNGHEIAATVDEQFAIVLGVAAGETSREEFTAWLREHIVLHP
jgi:death-on-curing protein